MLLSLPWGLWEASDGSGTANPLTPVSSSSLAPSSPLLSTCCFSPFTKSLQTFGSIGCGSSHGAEGSAQPRFGSVVNTINNSGEL